MELTLRQAPGKQFTLEVLNTRIRSHLPGHHIRGAMRLSVIGRFLTAAIKSLNGYVRRFAAECSVVTGRGVFQNIFGIVWAILYTRGVR